MRREYDLRGGKPNPYAKRLGGVGRAAVLERFLRSEHFVRVDDDLADEFRDEATVNATLRLALQTKRLGDRGIIGFVPNANFIEANTADGLRKCLAEEFSNLYLFQLRGNARTSGERRRKERGNVFGERRNIGRLLTDRFFVITFASPTTAPRTGSSRVTGTPRGFAPGNLERVRPTARIRRTPPQQAPGRGRTTLPGTEPREQHTRDRHRAHRQDPSRPARSE